MSEALPEFKGRLAPASWSTLFLTPALEHDLKHASLPDCKGCAGKGWYGDRPRVEICHCVIRKISSR